MLTVDRLTKRFGGFTALNGISFSVKQGEILGLIGPNGSGKTTCFNCVSGALVPTSGSIRFKDRDVAGLAPDAVCHRGIARTFQIPRPFRKLSILENVAVAAHFGVETRDPEGEAIRRAQEILALVGLPGETLATTSTARRGRPQEARAGARARHGAHAAARRREPGGPRSVGDERCRGDAPPDPGRARRHDRLGRAHHGDAPARGRSPRRARPRGEVAEGTLREVAENPQVIEAYLGKPVELG